jgi:hypothetical protein
MAPADCGGDCRGVGTCPGPAAGGPENRPRDRMIVPAYGSWKRLSRHTSTCGSRCPAGPASLS